MLYLSKEKKRRRRRSIFLSINRHMVHVKGIKATDIKIQGKSKTNITSHLLHVVTDQNQSQSSRFQEPGQKRHDWFGP